MALPSTFTLSLFSDGILEILPPQNLTDKEQYLLQLFADRPESMQALSKAFKLDDVKDAPDDIAVLMISKR
jgi:hypothetical protein